MRKGDSRKSSILLAAERLFLSRGYLATTLNDILDEVGCTKGSFYHHFDTKFAVLDQIVMIRAARALQAYRDMQHPDAMAALESLLYHALPFRKDERDFLAVVLALGDAAEGTLVAGRLMAQGRALFLPEAARLLAVMEKQGLASVGSLPVGELVWAAHTAFCQGVLHLIRTQPPPFADVLLPQLRALRFLWERVLDLPYGSMTIIGLEEMADAAAYAAHRAAAEAPKAE